MLPTNALLKAASTFASPKRGRDRERGREREPGREGGREADREAGREGKIEAGRQAGSERQGASELSVEHSNPSKVHLYEPLKNNLF